MDILHALAALRDASDNFLYTHREEAVLTIREVGNRLERIVFRNDSTLTTISRCHSCQRQLLNNEAWVRQPGTSISGVQRNIDNISPTTAKQRAQANTLLRSRPNDTDTSGAERRQPLLLFASLMKEIPWVWDFI